MRTRNSEKARRICFDAHHQRDKMGFYLRCHMPECNRIIRPHLGDKWRADHIQRWAEGGDDTAENLRPICIPCDTGKNGKAATDTREVAKGKRVNARFVGIKQRTGWKRQGFKYNWTTKRYERADD